MSFYVWLGIKKTKANQCGEIAQMVQGRVVGWKVLGSNPGDGWFFQIIIEILIIASNDVKCNTIKDYCLKNGLDLYH